MTREKSNNETNNQTNHNDEIFSLCTIFAMTAEAAATLTVTSTGDTTVGAAGCSDGCSLREAVTTAASGDKIQFDAATFSTAQTINLNVNNLNGCLNINKNLTITGPGARLLNSTVSGSTGFDIFSELGTLNIAKSTISGNNGNAQGIAGRNLKQRTVANNVNGGIENQGGTINLRNTIITGSTVSADAIGAFVSQGNTLVSNATERHRLYATDRQNGRRRQSSCARQQRRQHRHAHAEHRQSDDQRGQQLRHKSIVRGKQSARRFDNRPARCGFCEAIGRGG